VISLSAENSNVVYSTDSKEHQMNMGEVEEDFSTLGMYQDKEGVWQIKEELMWDGEF
jgi:hypothetical protein